jgi:hypothetical protein
MTPEWKSWADSVEARLAQVMPWIEPDQHGDPGIVGVMGEVAARLRNDVRNMVNDTRKDLNLPVIRSRVRIKAGVGLSW